jgi:hypothetical protein
MEKNLNLTHFNMVNCTREKFNFSRVSYYFITHQLIIALNFNKHIIF